MRRAGVPPRDIHTDTPARGSSRYPVRPARGDDNAVARCGTRRRSSKTQAERVRGRPGNDCIVRPRLRCVARARAVSLCVASAGVMQCVACVVFQTRAREHLTHVWTGAQAADSGFSRAASRIFGAGEECKGDSTAKWNPEWAKLLQLQLRHMISRPIVCWRKKVVSGGVHGCGLGTGVPSRRLRRSRRTGVAATTKVAPLTPQKSGTRDIIHSRCVEKRGVAVSAALRTDAAADADASPLGRCHIGGPQAFLRRAGVVGVAAESVERPDGWCGYTSLAAGKSKPKSRLHRTARQPRRAVHMGTVRSAGRPRSLCSRASPWLSARCAPRVPAGGPANWSTSDQ